DISTSTFHFSLLYNVNYLFDAQLQDKTTTLNNISNDKGLIGSTTDIRLL
ncbi:4694_t:CDS:1, partial [Funneliformis geosporum]